jgi:ankyrin repeat protein
MDRIKGQIQNYRELAHQTLSWITCAKRPLTTLELQHALAVEVGESELDEENLPEIENIVSVCAGLVLVDQESDIIRLVHYTTQEFFERTQTDWFPNAQEDLAVTCVTYLSFDIFGSGSCSSDEEFEDRLRLNPLYDYAARNWGYHICGKSAETAESTLHLLESEFLVSACSQALMVPDFRHSGYSRTVNEATGLHLAAYFALLKIVASLLEKGCQPDHRDSRDQTPLLWAAMNGHEAVAKLLVERDDVEADSKDKNGQTPLLWAAMNGHEAVAKLLVERDDVKADSKDKNGQTPLSWAARMGHETIVKLLAERDDVETDSKNKYGWTPLSLAARMGHETVVKLLAERDDVETDSKDTYGQTPLSWAAEMGQETIVKLLAERADVETDSKDKYGRTPLSLAAETGQETIVKLLAERDDVETDSKDKDGRTPLSWATEMGQETIVKLLAERDDVETDSKDKYGRTPLLWAVARGHVTILKLLLSKDTVDPNAKDRYGKSPLHLAIGNGHEVAMKAFLAEEAVDLASSDSFSQTPLSWASRKGHFGIVKILRESYHKKGIVTHDGDPDVVTSPAMDLKSDRYCDICLCRIPNINIHYHCGICSHGDFDICQECFACGAFCFESHKLTKRMMENDTLVEVPD